MIIKDVQGLPVEVNKQETLEFLLNEAKRINMELQKVIVNRGFAMLMLMDCLLTIIR